MVQGNILPRAFYDRDPVIVAQALLGKQLIREDDDGVVTGRIIETEAYLAAQDPASHAYSTRRHGYRITPRCAPMFGPPGHAYVYRSYGRHYCWNLVTEGEGVPSAVLLRAVQPERGLDVMHRRRSTMRQAALANGPGNLCRAFAIDLALNGWDVTRGARLWVAMPPVAPALQIVRSRRIGVTDDLELRFAAVFRCTGGAWCQWSARREAGTVSGSRHGQCSTSTKANTACAHQPRVPCYALESSALWLTLPRRYAAVVVDVGPYERLLRDGTRAIRERCTAVDTSMPTAYW